MPRYEIQTSQFGMISGIRQAHSDMVLIAEPAGLFAPEVRKGQLYIVAEAEGDPGRGRDACQLVLRTIRKTFYEDSSYSVTAALRKALIAANRVLYDQNFNLASQKRVFVGVTCAVIKEQDLHVAQVLPAQIYMFTQGKLRALPTHVSWNPTPTGTPLHFKLNAIGASLSVEPDFYRAVLKPGDSVLLSSSNFGRSLSQEDAMRLLKSAEPEEALEMLTTVCKQHELTDAQGLLINITPPLSPAAQAAPLSRVGVLERSRLALRSMNAWATRVTGEAALLVQGPGAREKRRKAEARREQQRREQERLTQLPEEPKVSLDRVPLPRPLDLGESLEERAMQARQQQRSRLGMPPPREVEDEAIPPSVMLGETNYAIPSTDQRRIDLSDTPSMAALGRSARGDSFSSRPTVKSPYDMTMGERIAEGLFKLRSMMRGSRVGHRKLPPSAMAQSRRPVELSYRRQRQQPFSVMWLLILVLLVAIFIMYGWNLAEQNMQRAANDSLERAEAAMAAVRAAPTIYEAELLLSSVEVALGEVRASEVVTATQENRLRYEQLEQEYERAVSSIKKLSYFEDLQVFAQHPVPNGVFSSVVVPPPIQSITNTANFNWIYLLDSNVGVLYRMPKNGGPIEEFLRPDDTINQVPIGTIRAQAWRFDNIVAVAQNGEGGPFTFYFPTGGQWGYSNLAGSSEWGRVNQRFRAVNYDGNLYIWGAVPEQILRYRSGNYGDFPDPWIQETKDKKVDSALDMAIDGKIYLLQPNGNVLVFMAGSFEREIVLEEINPALVTASSFFVSPDDPESGWIFLVDSNQGRIIQLDKVTGKFIQQIQAPPDSPIKLDQLTGLYVDETGGRTILYLVNGGQILRASLPDPPRPFREPGSQTPVSPTITPTSTP
jgi:serine/threonine protein phosphatase PrpC/predicted nucleic acid-binding Zn ribbon protein